MDLKCRKCGRWLGHADGNIGETTIKCGNCKTNNKYRVIMMSTYDGKLFAKTCNSTGLRPEKACNFMENHKIKTPNRDKLEVAEANASKVNEDRAVSADAKGKL